MLIKIGCLEHWVMRDWLVLSRDDTLVRKHFSINTYQLDKRGVRHTIVLK